MRTIEAPTFQDDCREALADLRGALLDLHADLGADATRPQDVSRRLGLNKNLTWKVARIVQAEDPLEAAALVPGQAGLDIFVCAFEKAGVSASSVERARAACRGFEEMIERHAGDRAMFDAMLDSMGVGTQAEAGDRKSVV